jgi:hypothetical protein
MVFECYVPSYFPSYFARVISIARNRQAYVQKTTGGVPTQNMATFPPPNNAPML